MQNDKVSVGENGCATVHVQPCESSAGIAVSIANAKGFTQMNTGQI